MMQVAGEEEEEDDDDDEKEDVSLCIVAIKRHIIQQKCLNN